MKRFLSCAIASLLTVCTLIACFSAAVSAESLYIRKIVSVVYDDSGSMKNDDSANWAYASYAMQSFCGLLNNDDRLFITYMSQAEDDPGMTPPEIDLSASKIQNSVNTIRNHNDYGNTPYSAVDIAFDKLKSVEDSNGNTQYWLVVITDGAFQGGSSGYVTKNELNTSLSEYSDMTMPNGSKPQITYLAIGDIAEKPDQNTSSGIYVYSSSGSSDIINVMADIADKVSGRSRLSDRDIVLTDSKTIQITSSVPLLNIAILSQKTSAKVVDTQYTNGEKLNIERSAYTKHPQQYPWRTDTSLNGGAFLIGNEGESIQAGTYTVRFDSEISLDNVVVMFEPALEVRMVLSVNGNEVKNYSDLSGYYEKDSVSASCKIYEIGTDKEISPSLLPQGTKFSLSVNENGKTVKKDESSSMTVDGFAIHNTLTEIVAAVTIPGFNPITVSTGRFTPRKPDVYTLEVEQPDNFSLTTSELVDNNKKITFIIKFNGTPVSKAVAETLDFEINTSAHGDIVVENDGSISFTPRYPDSAASLQTGKNTVTGVLNGTIRKEGSFVLIASNYSIEIIEPDDFSLTIEGLKNNTKKISFIVKEEVVALPKDMVEALGFSVSTIGYGTVVYENDGSVSFTPRYKEPKTAIPTGDITVTGSIGNIASASTSFYIKPIEYTIVATSPDDNEIIRGSFNDTKKTLTFEVFADGEKLDKTAIEASNVEYCMNKPYDKRLKLNITVDSDGTISATPEYEKWNWFAVYVIPKGELQITTACNGSEGTGTLLITSDIINELVFNLLVPAVILLIVLGWLFKKRFKYNSMIYTNNCMKYGSSMSGAVTGWDGEKLWTLSLLLPILPDRKTIRGVTFYASRSIFGDNSSVCIKKTKQYNKGSGVVCIDKEKEELSITEQEINFSIGDVTPFNDEKWRDIMYENAFVIPDSEDFNSCTVFVYTE